MNSKIIIKNSSSTRRVPLYEDIKSWALLAIKSQHGKGDVAVELVDADTSQMLNHQYRAKDHPTNVLSFPLKLDIAAPIDFLGEIYICPEVVQKEALEQNKPYPDHFAHMVIHGCLHLMGFDHETEAEAAIMEDIEIKLLANLNIKNPYDDA